MKITKFNAIIGVFLFVSVSLSAQNNYSIDITKVKTDVKRGHLDLGGSNAKGDKIEVNSFYLERNGKPFIPVIGEFHFSRYPHQYWDEQLKKMKAGGITVVATYVFWNMHEFKEGKFDWTADLNVRKFTELCAKNGLEVIMRIGPFAHGEIRNGGLPDWLYGRPIDVRSNDQVYLYYVNRLYQEIGKQLKGLLFKDNGPIIGVQLENEYQHSTAPWGFTYQDAPKERTVAGRDKKIIQDGVGVNTMGNEFADVGKDHMKTLKKLAIDAGLVAPIYTATGWGYATIVEKGSIPVMAGYAYPFWTAGNSPSPFYLFKNIHQQPDYAPVSYDVNLYPSLAAELGTGMAVTYSRRPRVLGESFLPMMVRTVGSGTNGLGFYMYHGGTTPSIGNYFFTEGAGLHNKSYDYQAPIGEFGNVSSGYYPLKLMNYFLKSYGNDLAPLYPILPSTNDSIKATDTSTLRYAVRGDGDKGYLFMHNFQDHLETKDLKDLKIDIATQSGAITFPQTGTFTLKSGSSAIFPFNVNYDGIAIRMATVQPFCRFTNTNKKYNVMVSIDGIAPEIVLKGIVKVNGIKTLIRNGNTVVVCAAGKTNTFEINDVSFLVLPKSEAEKAYLIGENNNQKLVVSEAVVLDDTGKITLVSNNQEQIDFYTFPASANVTSVDGKVTKGKSAIKNISTWKVSVPKAAAGIQLIQADNSHFVLKAGSLDLSKVNDVFITFDYRGDRGICMMNGELQTDDLYTSKPWTIGLKRYQEALKTTDMYFYFMPMQKDAPYLSYLDKKVVPDFSDKKSFLEVKQPQISVEYKVDVEFK
ncbi:Glycosyl hydrolases family 35 [Flavobacterium flevense]|uniref:Beta-galactosidase n=1 Tax=Flavobacterium flevense TaxID=983 RepID=A0A4Y4AZK1_9FLAO|nr:beta-galactosidase [Flavobacterium flevense]GEC72317.1 beta-galactosidase [Flavobacterium flevense]SHM08651.1 Glycosyl hydrolases family 35 [Flavobacterium flevense]